MTRRDALVPEALRDKPLSFWTGSPEAIRDQVLAAATPAAPEALSAGDDLYGALKDTFPEAASASYREGWRDALDIAAQWVDSRAATPAAPDLVLVRRDSGGVFPDGTTNHPPIDFDAPPTEVDHIDAVWGAATPAAPFRPDYTMADVAHDTGCVGTDDCPDGCACECHAVDHRPVATPDSG